MMGIIYEIKGSQIQKEVLDLFVLKSKKGVSMKHRNIFIFIAIVSFYSAIVLSGKMMSQTNETDVITKTSSNGSLEEAGEQSILEDSEVFSEEGAEEEFENGSRIEDPDKSMSKEMERSSDKSDKKWWQFWK